MDRWCFAFYRFSFCGSSYVGLMCILKSLSPSKISNLKQAIKHRGWVSEGIIRVLKAKGRGGRQKSKCSYETDVFADNVRGDSGFKSGPVSGVPKSRGTGRAGRWPLPPAPGSFQAFPPHHLRRTLPPELGVFVSAGGRGRAWEAPSWSGGRP